MTEASQYLLALARQHAEAYAAIPSTRAIIVMGSAAEGRADFYSDLDMCVYYETLPSEEELAAVRLRNRGADRLWCVGAREHGALAESFPVDGIECQIVHATIAAWERDMTVVREQLEVTSPLQKALSGILTCLPLYGEPLVHQWKAKAADYPDALAQGMVEKHLSFVAVWSLKERIVERDGILWLHQILVEAEYNLLGVLAGLNRLYFTSFQFKYMDAFLAKMTITPPDLSHRMKALLTAEPVSMIDQLKTLVSEVVDLVERHMPDVDTTGARQQLAKRQQPWSPVSDPR